MDIQPTILSLFSGYGGLELGLGRVLGSTRTICYVEREAYACANLVAAMQAEALAPAPIWSDVQTFDATGIRPDLLAAGIPCQPFSTAGKRRHTDDERWVWSDVARIISECRPGTVFLECTPGIRRQGLPVILRDLAAHGYDAAWTCDSRASDAGAPHRRSRFFLVAHSDGQQLRQLCWGEIGQGWTSAAQPQHNGEAMAYPPGPVDSDGWRRYIAAGGPQPGIRGGIAGPADRVDRVRLVGNGVCPAQAAQAFRELSLLLHSGEQR